MAETFKRLNASAFLLRGTEGEPVADARRTPQMEFFTHGSSKIVQVAQAGTLASIPELPSIDAEATAKYIQAVLNQQLPVPTSISLQTEHILQALKSL
jgi:anthranilate phosphoribosyltransferase